MSVVFISYSRSDVEIAQDIQNRLMSFEIQVVIPWRDETDIRPGERWHLEIDRAIQDSFAMLVICTDTAKKSPNVTYEWAYARGISNIQIIPIYFDKVDERVPLQLMEYQALDYNNGSFMSDLIHRLQDLQINDSLSNVRIPWGTDNYLRTLANRIFYNPYLDDSLDAIVPLFTYDDPLAREIIISGLNHKQRKIRDAIIEQIDMTEFNDSRIVAKLKQIFLDPSIPRLLKPIARIKNILSRMGDPTIQIFKEELYNPNPFIQHDVFEIFMYMRSPSIFPYVLDLLDNNDEEIQFTTVQNINSLVQSGYLRSSSDKTFQSTFDEAILPAFERLLRKRYEKVGTGKGDTMKMTIEACLRAIISQFPASRAGRILRELGK